MRSGQGLEESGNVLEKLVVIDPHGRVVKALEIQWIQNSIITEQQWREVRLADRG